MVNKISTSLILGAIFLSFSYNNLVLREIHFLLGSASFYLLTASILILNYKVSESDTKFLLLLSSYILLSAIYKNIFYDQILTTRPFSGLINIFIIFLVVNKISFSIVNNHSLLDKINKFFLYACYAVILICAIDIYAINFGGIQESFFESVFFRTHPGNAARLRGLTQEPSYFGMVLAVLYPIILCNFFKTTNLSNSITLLCFYCCLLFSLSKVGFVACALITLIIGSKNFSKLLYLSIILALIVPVSSLLGYDKVLEYNSPYINEWQIGNGPYRHNWNGVINPDDDTVRDVGRIGELGRVDNSTVIRIGSMVASFKLFKENFFLGAGLGQSNFVLNKYYPEWMLYSKQAEFWASEASSGGVPSFTFIPKIFSEIGLLGVLLILIRIIPLIKKIILFWNEDYYLRVFSYSFHPFRSLYYRH